MSNKTKVPKNFIGRVYESNNFGPIKVLSKLEYFAENDKTLLNKVDYIPYEELSKYCVGSTTIQEVGVGTKWFQSGEVSRQREKDIVSTPR